MKSSNIGKFVHIKKLCNDQGHLQMLAIDQRPPIFSLIKKKKKKYIYKDVVDFKKHISLCLSKHSTAILMDPVYSVPNLITSSRSKGLIVTLEDHDFIEKGKGRYSKNIKNLEEVIDSCLEFEIFWLKHKFFLFNQNSEKN